MAQLRSLCALVVVLSSVARADEVSEWVRQKVRDQRAAVERVEPTKGGVLWKEGPSRPLIPGFIPPTSLAPLVRAVRPAVVNVSTQNGGASGTLGSGFIINAEGLVVTNNHVVDRAEAIEVRLADGRQFDATVVGRDPSTDLALLRLEGASKLPIVTMGDSDLLEVGDWIVAIGNPFGLELSVTHGLISARERVLGLGPWDDFIQTNALINPGNSGGPLFDMRGEVVGVTTAIVSEGQGIGFAVPINLVKDLLPNLLDNGRPERGWLGVRLEEVADAVVIVDVVKDSPAEVAGLRAGDRITRVQGRPVERYLRLLRRIALLAPGTDVHIELVRAGKTLELTAALANRPSEEALKAMASDGRIDALGVAVRPVDPALAQKLKVAGALRVEVVIPGSPAERAAVQVGDVVLEANRRPALSIADLATALAETPRGDNVLLKLQRGDAVRYLAVRAR